MWTPCPKQVDEPLSRRAVVWSIGVRLVWCLGGVGVAAGLVLWRGVVLQCLWGWFLVPLLGWPALTLAQALGIACVGWMLTSTGSAAHTAPWSRTIRTPAARLATAGEALLAALVSPLLALAVGWVVKTF
jgi:hypothetical protein